MNKYAELDHAICLFLSQKRGHPTNSTRLEEMARAVLGPDYKAAPWRLIDRRMTAMKKAGMIKYVGRKYGDNGWRVVEMPAGAPRP